MITIIIGNVVALLGSLIMVYTGTLKDKKKILYFQSVQIGLFVLSNIILGGITGIIINIVGLIRNILCYKDKLGLKEKIIIIIASVGFSLLFNNLGIIGLLPVISTVVYIIFMSTKDVKKFKLLIAFTMVLWFIYDFYIKSYTSASFDFVTALANIITIRKISRGK